MLQRAARVGPTDGIYHILFSCHPIDAYDEFYLVELVKVLKYNEFCV